MDEPADFIAADDMCCHFTKTGENHHSTYTHILMESIAPLLAYIFLVFTSLVSFICEIRDKNNCRIGTPGESLVWKENVFLLIVIHPLSICPLSIFIIGPTFCVLTSFSFSSFNFHWWNNGNLLIITTTTKEKLKERTIVSYFLGLNQIISSNPQIIELGRGIEFVE